MNRKLTRLFLFLFIPLLFVAGCSGYQSNPVTSDQQVKLTDRANLPLSNDHREKCGEWTAEFNVNENNVIIADIRASEAHFNATPFVPRPQVLINSYNIVTHILDIDVTFTNPTNIDVFDPRLIIFTDNIGHQLLNPDDWTDLYDIAGGLPINPFVAYAREIANRKFGAHESLTEKMLIYMPQDNFTIRFALDVSVGGNCLEPYEISGFEQEALLSQTGSTAHVQVNVFDWQNDVNNVKLYCPAITGGYLLDFTSIDSQLWTSELINETGAGMGEYTGYLVAKSENSSSLTLYDEVTLTVSLIDPMAGWARTWGNNTNYAKALDVVFDKSNNIWVSGYFGGTVDFDPATGVVERTSVGTKNASLCKYDSMGNFLDVIVWGDGAEEIIPHTFEFDTVGNIWIWGIYNGTVDFDPGLSVYELTSSGYSYWSMFLLKLTANGDFIRAESLGGGFECPAKILIDDDNYIYLTGRSNSSVDFDFGPDEHEIWGSFLVKYDSQMNYLWGALIEDGTAKCYDAALGLDNNIYLTGYYKGWAHFNPGPDEILLEAEGADDVFLVRYDRTGQFLDMMHFGGTDYDWGIGVNVDSTGSVYLSGRFADVVDFDPGPGTYELVADSSVNMFLCKYSPNYDFIWAKNWSGTLSGPYVWLQEMDLEISADDSVYVTGTFKNTSDFDTGQGTYFLTSQGVDDFYITKHDPDGTWQWAQSWGADSTDLSYFLASDANNSIYVSGSFDSTVDFNPGPGIEEFSANAYNDAFMMKLKPNGEW
jgi:hypothetical protein